MTSLMFVASDSEQHREILGCPFFTAKGRYSDAEVGVVVLMAGQSITYSDDLPEDFEYDAELAGVRHFRFGPGLVEFTRDSLRQSSPNLIEFTNNRLQGTTSAMHYVAFSAKPVEDAPVWKLYYRE